MKFLTHPSDQHSSGYDRVVKRCKGRAAPTVKSLSPFIMVCVLVCKNDGVFEFETTDLTRLETWNDVKQDLARALYSEEELFAVGSPSDISLYAFPDGNDAEIVAEGIALESFLEAESKWVLDIFGSPFRRATDLSIQTDYTIRGMSKSSIDSVLTRRLSTSGRSSSMSNPLSPLGNASLREPTLTATPAPPSMQPAALQEPYIHIGTWVPMLVTDKSRSAPSSLMSVLKPSTSDYEDVLMTTNRAREYINRFRRIGRPVTIISIQSVTLPLSVACPNAISQHGARSLYDGVYHLNEQDMQRGFVQAVRFWFSFDCEQTISVTKVNGTLGLKPLRQQDGWIVVQALPGSPAFECGMRSDEVFLTHVNGVDVSPHAFPSVCDRFASQISWKDSVIPLVEKTETCIFTFF